MSTGDNQLTLKKLRERAGLTQRQLANALGVTVTTVSSWERGVKKPSLSFAQVQKVIETLHCSLEELVEATQPSEHEAE